MESFERLCAMPDAALHEAIALHCAGWQPMQYADVRAATGCTHRAPDGGFHTVPEYTASWDLTMPLANQARVTRRWVMVIERHADGSFSRATEVWEWGYHCYDRDGMDGRAVHVPATADDQVHRRALCRLALWRAMLTP